MIRAGRLSPLLFVAATAACGGSGEGRPAQSPADARSSSSSARTAGWVLVGVGVQAGVIGAGTGVLMLDANATRDDACDANKVCSQEGIDANARLRNLAPWNAGAFVVSGLALAGGLFLVLTNPRQRTTVGIAPGPSGAALRAEF